jgi:hypothetical protein
VHAIDKHKKKKIIVVKRFLKRAYENDFVVFGSLTTP